VVVPVGFGAAVPPQWLRYLRREAPEATCKLDRQAVKPHGSRRRRADRSPGAGAPGTQEAVAAYQGMDVHLKILEICGDGKFAAEVLDTGQGNALQVGAIVSISQEEFHHIDFDC
jgi:hypothetical protein